MVADVVEAMTSHRPYRPALGLDIALQEIKDNAGVLYNKISLIHVSSCLNRIIISWMIINIQLDYRYKR
jgi:hypothetical protein